MKQYIRSVAFILLYILLWGALGYIGETIIKINEFAYIMAYGVIVTYFAMWIGIKLIPPKDK